MCVQPPTPLLAPHSRTSDRPSACKLPETQQSPQRVDRAHSSWRRVNVLAASLNFGQATREASRQSRNPLHRVCIIASAVKHNRANMGDEPKLGARLSDVNLQSYPHVPKDDRSDPVAWANSREQFMREHLIAKERVKLLRQQVIACYRKEGVNHYVNCKHLTTKYLDIIQDKTFGRLKPPGAAADDDAE